MRIAFDGQIFGLQPYGGISRYFFELAKRLADFPEMDVAIVCPLYINAYLPASSPGLRITGRKAPGLPYLKFLVFPHATRRMIVEIKGFRSGLREFWQLIPKPSLARCLARDLRASPKANSVVFCEA